MAMYEEYRGYWICPSHGWYFGTSRIRRPDGSWRESPPTIVDGLGTYAIGWKSPAGDLEQIDSAESVEEARAKIDRLLR